MVKVKQYKRGISAFISSEKGQRFFNFAYSIGAAVVIWGALFKILHLPGGNMLLSLGMGTEVLMFVLTAFDRPPREYKWEEVFPALRKDEKKAEGEADGAEALESALAAEEEEALHAHGGIGGGGTIVIGGGGYVPAGEMPEGGFPIGEGGAMPAGGYVGGGFGFAGPIGPGYVPAEGEVAETEGGRAPIVAPTDFAGATQLYIDQVTSIAEELRRMQDTTEALNNVSETLLKSYAAISEHSEEIKESSTGYADQIQTLNRNIAGLNTIYEIQLKSVSSQIDAIDRVNKGIKDIRDMFEKSADQSVRYCEETEKMARYMQQLNQVYEKMIHAMTINMYGPMMPRPADEDNSKTDA